MKLNAKELIDSIDSVYESMNSISLELLEYTMNHLLDPNNNLEEITIAGVMESAFVAGLTSPENFLGMIRFWAYNDNPLQIHVRKNTSFKDIDGKKIDTNLGTYNGFDRGTVIIKSLYTPDGMKNPMIAKEIQRVDTYDFVDQYLAILCEKKGLDLKEILNTISIIVPTLETCPVCGLENVPMMGKYNVDEEMCHGCLGYDPDDKRGQTFTITGYLAYNAWQEAIEKQRGLNND